LSHFDALRASIVLPIGAANAHPQTVVAAEAKPVAVTASSGTSVPDLKRKLMRYIRHYNKDPKTVKWKYFDPTKRITSTSAVTVH
jgi:hypothetical protein